VTGSRIRRVQVHRSADRLPVERQLAFALAATACAGAPADAEVVRAVGDRIIDTAGVAMAALSRAPVADARAQAVAHPLRPGGTILGLDPRARVSPEWAAWANGVAVRELDFHDTYLAADYAHPADNIPAVLAVAQHCGLDGRDLVRGIAAAYEIHIALVRGIRLHSHRIDHIAHLGPSAAAGIGAALRLPVDAVRRAIEQALHVTTTTRQSRKGDISSWKAYAPAFAGKMAVEAVDRAMRGQDAPSPIYEGEDGVIAWLLDGPGARYEVPLPEMGAPHRAILETYAKEHSAEYQAQAMIDLALHMAPAVGNTARVRDILIETSHHTHTVIGSGSGDPQKYDPDASRGTLDHSLPYIVAVALEDRAWHHERSYAPERARRPATRSLWSRVRTVEDPRWSALYHHPDPALRAFGGRMAITLEDGRVVAGELAVAHAHPRGARPFDRRRYIEKFSALCDGVVADAERRRFLDAVDGLDALPDGSLGELTLTAAPERLGPRRPAGIFDRQQEEAP
jgi:2-methylcitrate dehydratase